MIRSFKSRGTNDIWDGTDTRAARRTCAKQLWMKARMKLDDVNQVRHYSDLRTPRSNRLHELRGDREGQWATAINDQYRICFTWDDADAFDVEITDYH